MGPTGLLVLRLAVLAALFLACLHLERRGRGVGVVLLVIGLVLVDATLYSGSETSSARSIFHPMLFGQSFRLSHLLIPTALLARGIARGRPRRFDASAPFWAAFFLWTAAAAVIGLLAGHERTYVLGEATMIINVGGMMLLAAGIPVTEYVSSRWVTRFFQGAAVVASGLFVLNLAGIRLSSTAIPDLPLVRFGGFGADAATLFSALGVLALVLGLARPRHLGTSTALVVPGVVLILSHLASSQRAARLGLYVTLLLLLVIACLPTARRRLGFTPRQVTVVGATALAIACAGVLVPAVVSATAPGVNVGAEAGQFAPTSRQGSIDSRFNQWNVVRKRIIEKPLVGEGLGGTFVSYSEGKKIFVEGDISHNIILDLLRRTGLVGVALFGASLMAVAAQTFAVWRFHPSTQIAAFGVAAATLAAGLLAKGMVESIFEKDRLAVLLGFSIGLAISAWLSLRPGIDPAQVQPSLPAPRHADPYPARR